MKKNENKKGFHGILPNWMMIAAGVLLVALLIGWVYTKVKSAQAQADDAFDQASQTMDSILESDITKYNGRNDISGAVVISAIQDFEERGVVINVVVDNGKAKTEYVYKSDLKTKIDSAVSSSDPTRKYNVVSDQNTYINPKAKFTGGVTRDKDTDTIVTLTFIKQK